MVPAPGPDKRRSPEGCEECLQMCDARVHLRECLICGHVGCSDSSRNKHATRHPLVQAFSPGEGWIWCYVDRLVLEPR